MSTIVRTCTTLSVSARNGTTVFDADSMARGAIDYANVADEWLRIMEPHASDSTSEPVVHPRCRFGYVSRNQHPGVLFSTTRPLSSLLTYAHPDACHSSGCTSGRPSLSIAGSFSAGPMLEPLNGLWSTARAATPWPSASLYMDGMQDSVRVTMDERGVPHIKADDDLDAIRALGYVVARDRLFEMDFIHRVSTGQLSALLGEGALGVDRYFHEMGIVDAVRRNTALLPDRMPREFEIISAYAAGANAWLADMNEDQVPLEYRLLGGAPPDEITPEYTMALYAFMAYDLSFRLNSDRRHAFTRAALGDSTYQSLFPSIPLGKSPSFAPMKGGGPTAGPHRQRRKASIRPLRLPQRL